MFNSKTIQWLLLFVIVILILLLILLLDYITKTKILVSFGVLFILTSVLISVLLINIFDKNGK